MSTVRFDPKEHRYWIGDQELVSVTTVLRTMGLDRNWSFADPIHRQRGQAVHHLCTLIDLSEWDDRTLNPETGEGTHIELIPYGRAYERFLSDSRFHVELIERQVASKDLMLAGTLDRAGLLNGRRVILDIKSGEPTHPAVDLQLALYAHLAERNLGYVAEGRMALWLRDDGMYRLIEPTRPFGLDVQDALAAVRLYWLRRAHGLLNGEKRL